MWSELRFHFLLNSSGVSSVKASVQYAKENNDPATPTFFILLQDVFYLIFKAWISLQKYVLLHFFQEDLGHILIIMWEIIRNKWLNKQKLLTTMELSDTSMQYRNRIFPLACYLGFWQVTDPEDPELDNIAHHWMLRKVQWTWAFGLAFPVNATSVIWY